MTRSSFAHSAIGLMLVIFFVIGCSVSAPTNTPITQTDIPIPNETSLPTDTPEPPPKPTTITAKPQPGTFSGDMENSIAGNNASASSGSIKFIVSEDGARIANPGYFIYDTKCALISRDILTMELLNEDDSSPIVNGNFEFISESGNLKIKGQFTSPTEANGTIEIIFESIDIKESCDFGTWVWRASLNPDV